MAEEKLKVIKEDPVAFAKFILDFHPFPYQESILSNDSERLIAVCGRQIGKSTTAAAKLVHFAVTHPKTTSIIVSATLRQSMEMFSKVRMFTDSSIVKRSITRMTRTQIFFNNGSRIICLPCGRYGSTLRGLTVHFAVVDEAAFIYPEVIESVIFPMLATTHGRIWLLTTPWDRAHITYKAFTSWPKDSVYHFPSSINPLITPAFLDEQLNLIGQERYNQEYLAQFVDDSRSYFPMTLIRPCIGETPISSDCCFAGYDPGGKESYAAAVAVNKRQDKLVVRRIWSAKGLSYTEATLKVAEMCKLLNAENLYVDQTGLGQPVVEHIKDLGISVDGLVLTDKRREELFTNLKLLLEQRKIILPDNLELIKSLNCIEYERTRVGGFRFTHRQGTYDDLAFALALACWAVKMQPSGAIVKL
ncbi:MAG: terminase family protein [Thaumarchaeota archaeon]|nr:terminase family protein [Nitrososphaerota archaeon]MCL5318617.1 terminase family protein [Nitrososphaerota archaeon]